MLTLRTIAVLASMMIHATIVYAMLPAEPTPQTPIDTFAAGTGEDAMLIEQGIAIEGFSSGDALQTIETADVTPTTQDTPPPINEVKPPDELRETITATESKVEDNIVKTEEPPPPTFTQPPPPEVVQAQEQPQQVAIATEQSSGEEQKGSIDPALFKQYLGKLSETVQKAKINPRSKLNGTVWVKFKVSPGGELLSREITSSSGSKVLDEAAVAALDRAAPFPPMPQEVATGPLDVSVPFKFVTR